MVRLLQHGMATWFSTEELMSALGRVEASTQLDGLELTPEGFELVLCRARREITQEEFLQLVREKGARPAGLCQPR